jgi:tetratricopeptide (TPR) repeat protein
MGFMFLHLVLLTFTTGVTSANSVVEMDQTLLQTTPIDPNRTHRDKLVQADITVPKGQEDEEGKNKLKRLIEQIRSIQFGSQIQIPEPSIVSNKDQVNEPNETPPDVKIQRAQKLEAIASDLPYERITDQTLQMLKTLSQRPDELDNPFELGEVLFLSQQFEDAVPFFQEALKRVDPNNMSSSQDRAWILFQIGNCLRNDDRPRAAEIYGQLLTEYPNSPWSDLAKVQRQLIHWHIKNEPYKLIAEVENVRGK